MCAALLLPNCRDAFLRLSQLPSLRDRRLYPAILLAETQECVSTTFRRTQRTLCAQALLLPDCRDAFLRLSQLPSLCDRRLYPAILLAETQECVSTSFRRTRATYLARAVVLNVDSTESCRDAPGYIGYLAKYPIRKPKVSNKKTPSTQGYFFPPLYGQNP